MLAIVEAVARLLPGVIGNAESLVEESHEDGLLEYPVYTKPPVWRGRDGPAGPALRRPRRDRRVAARAAPGRTAERRPDLRHVAAALDAGGLDVRPAQPADAAELAVLQRACWLSEAVANSTLDIPALSEDADEVRRGFAQWQTWVVRSGGRLVGSVRARVSTETPGQWEIGRLMVAPDLQGRGIGRALLAYAEAAAPAGTRRLWINTGTRSAANLRRYRRAGYRARPGEGRFAGTVDLVKDVPGATRFREATPALAESVVASGTRRAPATGGVDPRARMRVTRPAGTHTPRSFDELPVVTCGTARKRHRHAQARRARPGLPARRHPGVPRR